MSTFKKSIKHCKREYKVITPHSDNGIYNGIEVIEVKGNIYNVERLPRPAKNESELMCVIVNNIRYNSFAKFLKTL
jgi:hypothetical protein